EASEQDRTEGVRGPTRAHHAIARLVARGTVRVVITTNFDRLLEQALQALGIEPIVVASAAAAHGTIPLAHTSCTIIKVHGDYLDPNIKNTVGELKSYDDEMDALLDRAFDEYNVVVCGWSADWDLALRTALSRSASRRYGTYWASRGELGEHARRTAAARESITIPIAGADEFFESLVAKLEALDELAHRGATGVDLVVAQAKRFIPDPASRIRLRDLAMDTVDRAVKAIDFDGNPPSNDFSTYLEAVRRVERESADLVCFLTTLAQFADGSEQVDLTRRMLTNLAAPTDARLGGLTDWINLRGYPTLLGTYAVGLGSVSDQNWDPLGAALSLQARDPYRDDGALPYAVRYASWRVLSPEAVNSGNQPARRTPVSDHLHDYFQALLSSVLRVSTDQFAQVFDEWEYLLGVVIRSTYGRAPIGRFVWRSSFRYDDRFPDAALRASATALTNAGLFDSEPDRVTSVEQEYRAEIGGSGLSY
ncbi:MAG: SIR2 family protein, partial [Acidimicrobiia bacterium]